MPAFFIYGSFVFLFYFSSFRLLIFGVAFEKSLRTFIVENLIPETKQKPEINKLPHFGYNYTRFRYFIKLLLTDLCFIIFKLKLTQKL